MKQHTLPHLLAGTLTALLVIPSAPAQTGTLDQVSQEGGWTIPMDDPSFILQQQVRVGIPGQLETVETLFSGTPGQQAWVRLRRGDGYSASPAFFEALITKTGGDMEPVLLDVSAANESFESGETFVIEVQGNGTGILMEGSFVFEHWNIPPLYAEELFDGATQSCFFNCLKRMAFRTWMVNPDGNRYCPATANSTGSPAQISTSGSTVVMANDLVLHAAPVPDQFGIFFYGPSRIEVPFGNGFRCVGGSVGRLPVALASGGVLTTPVDYDIPPTPTTEIHIGSTWHFQAWYRDPAGGGSGFNLSDAVTLMFLLN